MSSGGRTILYGDSIIDIKYCNFFQLEKQRLAMEKQMESSTRGAKEEVLAMARKEAEHLLDAERMKYQELLEQKVLVEELLAKVPVVDMSERFTIQLIKPRLLIIFIFSLRDCHSVFVKN